jgi:hypothetical protein
MALNIKPLMALEHPHVTYEVKKIMLEEISDEKSFFSKEDNSREATYLYDIYYIKLMNKKNGIKKLLDIISKY